MSVRKVVVAAEALTPLALREGRNRKVFRTQHYISGSSLRGALSYAHSVLRPDRIDEFREFYLAGKVSYGNLVPASFKEDDFKDKYASVNPIPFTARTCKRCKGFINQGMHGVRDGLLPWLLFTIDGCRNASLLQEIVGCSYENCGAALTGMSGWYRRGDRAGLIGAADMETGLVSRVGINRSTGTARTGILFNREVLNKKTMFWGYCLVGDDLAEQWLQFVSRANQDGLIRVGSARTSGFGQLRIDCRPEKMSADATAIKERGARFNQLLRKMADHYDVKVEHNYYLPLTLTADLIAYDRLLRYQTVLTGDYLQQTYGLSARLVYQSARLKRISGWNSLEGLPKQDSYAISAGSVFVYSFPEEPNFELLQHMEEKGLGGRHDEGFGRILWADPWHLEVNPI